MIIILSWIIAEKCKGYFISLWENTEKYINFSVPMEKEVTRIDKKEKEVTKTISYRLQFIDSAKFMANLSKKIFTEDLLAIEMKKKIKILINKSVY